MPTVDKLDINKRYKIGLMPRKTENFTMIGYKNHLLFIYEPNPSGMVKVEAINVHSKQSSSSLFMPIKVKMQQALIVKRYQDEVMLLCGVEKQRRGPKSYPYLLRLKPNGNKHAWAVQVIESSIQVHRIDQIWWEDKTR